MLKLFIAKLSVYASCVPRSQSFYCRIKMSLLFNARNVSFGCSGFQIVWLFHAVGVGWRVPPSTEGAYGSGQGNSQAWGTMLLRSLLLPSQLPAASPLGVCQRLASACLAHGLWYPPLPDGSLYSAPAGVSVVPSTLQMPARLPTAGGWCSPGFLCLALALIRNSAAEGSSH